MKFNATWAPAGLQYSILMPAALMEADAPATRARAHTLLETQGKEATDLRRLGSWPVGVAGVHYELPSEHFWSMPTIIQRHMAQPVA